MERGTLVRWNNDKGFGFIKPETSSDVDVFIHITTLKHMARKPLVGDEIRFHRENQPDGKVKAVKASIEGVAIIAGFSHAKVADTPVSKQSSQPLNNKANPLLRTSSSAIIGRIILVLVVLNLAIYGFNKYQDLKATAILTNEDVEQIEWTPAMQQPSSIIPSNQFRCETGKTHCSHMRSCAEATFYTRNCPGTEMDGDGDGVPCERQFCG